MLCEYDDKMVNCEAWKKRGTKMDSHPLKRQQQC